MNFLQHSQALARTPTVTDVARAWQTRQESIKSARFSWTKELFVGPHNPMTKVTSPKQAQHTFDAMQVVLSVSDEKFRLETPIPTSQGGLSKMIHAFDGHLNKMLVTKTGGQHNSGAIGAEDYFYDLKNIHLRPALMYLRPLHPRLITLRPETFSIRDGRDSVNGRECVVLLQKTSSVPDLSEIYWLDPKLDYLPLQWQERYNGVTSAMVQVTYERNPDGVVVPQSWRCSFFDLKGGFREGSRASDVTVALNPMLEPDDFSIDFPEGAVVGDRRQRGEQFVVASDGSLRPLGLDSPGGPLLPQGRWFVLVALVVASLLVGGFLWRRKGFGFKRGC
jgi:hypothetical protein